MSKPDWRTTHKLFGAGLTAAWLALCAGFIYWRRSDVIAMPPNAWGDMAAGFAAPLAFLWLVLGYLQQGRELRSQGDDLRRTVESQVQAERAYMVIAVAKPGVQWSATGISANAYIKNCGRTPARLLDAQLGFRIVENGERLPEPSMDRERPAERSAFLVPNDSLTVKWTANLPQPKREDVQSGAKALWLWVICDYEDSFGRKHRCMSARIYRPSQQGGDLNIDRSEERGLWQDSDRPLREGEIA